MKLKSIKEILEDLKYQADNRALENDESGCISAARDFLIDDLIKLNDGYDDLIKLKNLSGNGSDRS